MASLKTIECAYERIAHKWAEAFEDEHRNKPKDQELLKWFAAEIPTNGRVLDLACGPGNTTRFLVDLGISVEGVDLSTKFVMEAKQRHPGISFVKGNMLSLQYDTSEMAGVVCFYGIVHFSVSQIQQAFDEVYRVLNDTGLFLFTYHVGEDSIHTEEFLGETVDIDLNFFQTAPIIQCLHQSGFEQIAVVERDPYPEVEYQSRRAYVIARKSV